MICIFSCGAPLCGCECTVKALSLAPKKGKTLPPAMTGCRHGGRGAFVLRVSNCPRWEDQSRSNHKPNPSIPQSLLTDIKESSGVKWWENEWQWSASPEFYQWKRDQNFSSSDRTSRIPAELVPQFCVAWAAVWSDAVQIL